MSDVVEWWLFVSYVVCTFHDVFPYSAGVYTRAPGATFPGTEYSFNVVVEDVSLVRRDVSSKVRDTIASTVK